MSDIDTALDRDVRPFVADMPITMEGHEILAFGGEHTKDTQRYEAILKSVFVQYCRATGRDVPPGGMTVKMTYDPVSSPHRPIYGPIFGQGEVEEGENAR